VYPDLFGPSGASAAYNAVVTIILLLTVWFANFAEALAEGRGKAKAASLRRTKTELMARRVLTSGEIEQVPATVLRKDDVIRVNKGEVIPTDGEVIEGVAYVDESAITGESAPVMKEPGTDMFSSVTAGTLLISDSLLVRATYCAGDPRGLQIDRQLSRQPRNRPQESRRLRQSHVQGRADGHAALSSRLPPCRVPAQRGPSHGHFQRNHPVD
jgi:high-affinity K+ transport system ATPase subunit B